MVVIAITGATGTIGYEAARQLSYVPEVKKLVLTSRSSKKIEDAIATLAKETGQSKSFYGSVIVDFSDASSVHDAVAAFPAFDRICLNAGGLSEGMHKGGTGINETMIINTIGHAALVDGLIAAGKCPAGNRIVYVSTEIARDIWSLVPLAPSYSGNFKEKDIGWAITSEYDGVGSCCPIRRQLGSYKNAKIVGSMHFAHLAKERPELHVMTVSPGAAGGGFADVSRFPMKQIMGLCGVCPFRSICVGQAFTTKGGVRKGAARYVEVLTGDEPAWKTGSMPMSGYPFPCCCCLWAACGDMIDNRPLTAYFRDEALCQEAAAKVREYSGKFMSTAPSQSTMTH